MLHPGFAKLGISVAGMWQKALTSIGWFCCLLLIRSCCLRRYQVLAACKLAAMTQQAAKQADDSVCVTSTMSTFDIPAIAGLCSLETNDQAVLHQTVKFQDRFEAFELFCATSGLKPTTCEGCRFDFHWFDRLLSMLQANAMGDTVRPRQPEDLESLRQLEASGQDQQHVSLLQFGSLFNHSCVNNVGTDNASDHTTVFRTVRSVNVGEQLFGVS